MTREDYARNWASARAREHGRPTFVPEDVERLEHHEPCFLCGSARGCRHRIAA